MRDGVTMLIFPALALLFAKPLSIAVPPTQSVAKSCKVTESSIFDELVCGEERTGSLTKADVTVAKFAIGQSTLKEVLRRFPNARKFRLTKEEEAAEGICVKNAKNQAVVFASGWTGSWNVLDAIYLGDSTIFENKGVKCLAVDSLDNISTESGVKIGMDAKDVLTRLHKPTVRGSSFYINFSSPPDKAPWVSGKVKLPSSEGWVAMSGAMGGFKAGHLRWLALYGAVSD